MMTQFDHDSGRPADAGYSVLASSPSRRQRRILLVASVLALTIAGTAPAWADAPAAAATADPVATDPDETSDKADDIIVHGINAPTTSSTGLPLTFMQTPQSVTIIDQKRIKDFALTNIRDLLDQVVGVNVEREETDRTEFNARGFNVTNFQIDGIGLPLIGNLFYGDEDSFLYDRIDIIRGANGLTTGIGNPSATINYVRKRPLDDLHADVAAYGGSWNKYRFEADVSVPLSDRFAVRLLAAHEHGDSYLDNYHINRNVYGIVGAAKITPDLTLTMGYNRQENHDRGSTWGSLTLLYSDGSFIPYSRSANPAPPFAKWPITQQQAYSELAYRFGDWQLKGVLTYRRYQDAPIIDYQYGLPDKVTGTGYFGDIASFKEDNKRMLYDLMANGGFRAFGQDQKLTFGASYSHDRMFGYQAVGNGAYPYPDFNNPDRFNIPEPVFPDFTKTQDSKAKLLRLYIASQLNFTDKLHAVVGTSWSKYDAPGTNYGATLSTRVNKFNPYAGVLYDLTSFLTAYASYTTIFNPQVDQKIDRTQLAPLTGTNMEAGLKANFLDKRFYLTATVFQTKEKNLSTYAGFATDDFGGFYYYRGEDIRSRGFEIEAAGHITPNWALSGGYTKISLHDETTNSPGRTFIPRQTFKASTTYTLPDLHNASVGLQLRWQDEIYALTSVTTPAGSPVTIRQPSYAIVDLMAGVDVVKNVRASLVLRNVTNKLFYTSLASGAFANAYYGAGRNVTGSIAYRF